MKARRQQCKALLSDKSRRCTRWAMKGQDVCYVHGGNSPQARKSARQKLDELLDPGLVALTAALDQVERHPGLSLNPSVVRVAEMILDRCGFPRATKLQIEEHELRISESLSEDLVRIIMAVLEALEVHTSTPEVRRLVGEELRREAGVPSPHQNGHPVKEKVSKPPPPKKVSQPDVMEL